MFIIFYFYFYFGYLFLSFSISIYVIYLILLFSIPIYIFIIFIIFTFLFASIAFPGAGDPHTPVLRWEAQDQTPPRLCGPGQARQPPTLSHPTLLSFVSQMPDPPPPEVVEQPKQVAKVRFREFPQTEAVTCLPLVNPQANTKSHKQ